MEKIDLESFDIEAFLNWKESNIEHLNYFLNLKTVAMLFK